MYEIVFIENQNEFAFAIGNPSTQVLFSMKLMLFYGIE